MPLGQGCIRCSVLGIAMRNLMNEIYYENSNNSYKKVGTKKPNPWGLYDMHGNVCEWTLDEYKENAYAFYR